MEFMGIPPSPMGAYSTAIAQGAPGGLPVPTADLVGTYVRVSDLYGEKSDVLLCSAYTNANGTKFFWQPVRPVWMNTTPILANQNMTLMPLRSPSIVHLTGALSNNRTITMDKALAWPGCEFNVIFEGTLGIYGLSIAGLAAGAVLGLLAGGSRRVVFDGTEYRAVPT